MGAMNKSSTYPHIPSELEVEIVKCHGFAVESYRVPMCYFWGSMHYSFGQQYSTS